MGAMLMLGSCSTSDSIMEGSISLSNVSHSECENHSRTRGDEDDPYVTKPMLRLTYNEADQTITGEYINYMLNCN